MNGDALFGTIDSFLIWKLTNHEKHVTDVTNASRTLLMNINTLQYDEHILNTLNIPHRMLPEIVPSSSRNGFGNIDERIVPHPPLGRVPITGVLGRGDNVNVIHNGFAPTVSDEFLC